VLNALASGEQSTRNGLLALGYEGPITCTTDTTQSGTQPDEFRNVGSQDRTLQPTSDTYVEIYVTKYRITCTQTAVAPCGDNAPTPAGYSLVKGTAGNDNLIGGSGKQIIKGLGGNDRISDLSGDDIICGGPGDDTLSGGGGNDLLLGGTGNDSLDGSSGTDTGYDADSGTRYTSIEKVL
jgi:Ca2+-binding RTX toxin-like protein